MEKEKGSRRMDDLQEAKRKKRAEGSAKKKAVHYTRDRKELAGKA
jgi:hypothetical protein